jgi:hypothetical protein
MSSLSISHTIWKKKMMVDMSVLAYSEYKTFRKKKEGKKKERMK